MRDFGYTCDALGRQALTIYPDGSVSSNTFNSAGELVKTARYADQDSAPLAWEEYGYDGIGGNGGTWTVASTRRLWWPMCRG